jgi:alkylated DNA repair dioxygenase AlkB
MIKHIFSINRDIDSEFHYLPKILSDKEQEKLTRHLNSMNDFRPCNNFKNMSSRYQKWYQHDMKYFCPKWKKKYDRWESFEYDDMVVNIQTKIENRVKLLISRNCFFNSCLINKYENGNNYIHRHRDSVDSFGEYPIIIGLSLGSVRQISFNKVLWDTENPKSIKKDRENPINFSFKLEPGSIFIMSGSSQKYFSHEIPKSDSQEIRYSLTFRNYIL